MTTEEAKKILLNCYPMKTTHVLDDTNKANKEAIEVVLKELYKKDKVINEMLNIIIRISIRVPGSVFKELRTNGFKDSLCEHCRVENSELSCKKCIKEFLYKKVEEQE